RLVISALGMAGGAAVGPSTVPVSGGSGMFGHLMAGQGAAHGGTWRVGGFGGLDTKLVRMKLSPGELVKVSNGANSRGRGDEGGGFHGTLIVRPPAVISDDVMA